MKVKVIEEHGYNSALLGISLNKKQPIDNMPRVANILAHTKGGGHDKCLEHIEIWLDITAPRYFWSEADTYRLSSKSSESTMHTIATDVVDRSCFEDDIPQVLIDVVIEHQQQYNKGLIDIQKMKSVIPESWLQRRMWKMSYKTFKNIYYQRKSHKLRIWRECCESILEQLEHPHLIVKDYAK